MVGGGDVEPKAKQPKLKDFIFKSNCTQGQLNDMIVNHVIDSIGNFTLGEEESFKNIVKLLDPNKSSPCYRTIIKLIDGRHDLMYENLLNELSKAVYVSICTDAWSGNHKSYAGYTATWLDENLVRNFAVLAVRRVKGSHSFEIVKDEIIGILKEFR